MIQQELDAIRDKYPIELNFSVHPNRSVTLSHLAVKTPNQGVGKQVMDEFVAVLDKYDYDCDLSAMILHDPLQQQRLWNFYKRVGFEHTHSTLPRIMWRLQKRYTADNMLDSFNQGANYMGGTFQYGTFKEYLSTVK